MIHQNQMFWRTPVVIALVVAAAIVMGMQTSSSESQAVRDGVFLHVSSGPENPHRVLMALKMAEIMMEDKDVLVYFDIKGIGAVLKDAPDLAKDPFSSSKTALKNLIDKGVPVFACPGCLEANGKKPEDLMDGIQVANKEAFFDFTKGRILTLDY